MPTLTSEERYIADHWPKHVPGDCSNQNSKGQDCIEQRVAFDQQCISCRVYDQLWVAADIAARKARRYR